MYFVNYDAILPWIVACILVSVAVLVFRPDRLKKKDRDRYVSIVSEARTAAENAKSFARLSGDPIIEKAANDSVDAANDAIATLAVLKEGEKRSDVAEYIKKLNKSSYTAKTSAAATKRMAMTVAAKKAAKAPRKKKTS